MDQFIQQTTNAPYIEPNVLQYRLDTNELLTRIEVFLSGHKLIYKQMEGGLQAVKIRQGDPVANETGVQSLVSWLGMQLTPQTVQGYFDDEQYFDFLERTRKELARIILNNAPYWGVQRDNRKLIISSIMNMLEMFVSRTKDNTERGSYVNNQFMRGKVNAPEEKNHV